MKRKCILLHNSKKDFTAEAISIKKFNKKYHEIRSDSSIEYVLIPISMFSESYIATPVIAMPLAFNPISFTYTVTLSELTQDFRTLAYDNTICGSRTFVNREMETKCDTIYELYVFVYSIIKMMAYNSLQNTCRFSPGMYNRELVYQNHNYVFDIPDIRCKYLNKDIILNENNIGLMNVISSISMLFLNQTSFKELIIPDLFKFYIDTKKHCSYTHVTNLSKLDGKVNKFEDHLKSCACNNWSAYSFISNLDYTILNELDYGTLIFGMYTLMGDPDDFEDYPITISTILNHPTIASVQKIEEYKLYSVSDYIEAVAFAGDMLSMMRTISELVGDEFKDCVCCIEIHAGIKTIPNCKEFVYTITDENISFGEVTDVVDDFITSLTEFIEDMKLPI